MILLFPVIAIIGILIKLDTPGPIFFVQERVGVQKITRKNTPYWQQVLFRCYKFRTMISNADPSLHQAYVKALINNDDQGMATLQGGEDSKSAQANLRPKSNTAWKNSPPNQPG